MDGVKRTKNNAPLQIVVLGGTGDLANRKLLPALFDLYTKKVLPAELNIIGVARSIKTEKQYRKFVEASIILNFPKAKQTHIRSFCKHVTYVPGLFDSPPLYKNLHTAMNAFDVSIGTCTNKLYYLAVPPQFYESIFSMLYKHRLHKACDKNTGWARILVEKPFGRDFDTAQVLDKKLGSYFNEEQIYRIDHYLAKEAVQNILSFRFANTLMQGIWNRENIASIHISMHETVDVSNRSSFYDNIGALRDVGQNHLLQLLALLTMEEPRFFEPEYIRKERHSALSKLKVYGANNVELNFQRGQYAGYRAIDGVKKRSDTETFFRLRAFSNHSKWKWVPFYIEAGKAVKEAKVQVVVKFKDVASGLFETDSCRTSGNVIELTISPEQAMHITLNSKMPGLGYQLESRKLSFDCPLGKDEVTNSYEKVLIDCINGDQTLFPTTKEVLAQWKFINPFVKNMHLVKLQRYKKGSRGPKDSLPYDV